MTVAFIAVTDKGTTPGGDCNQLEGFDCVESATWLSGRIVASHGWTRPVADCWLGFPDFYRFEDQAQGCFLQDERCRKATNYSRSKNERIH